MIHHDPWDVRDPGATITEVLRRQRPKPGDVLVALLSSGASPDQSIVDVVRVHRGDRPDRHDASDLLRGHAQALAGDRPWVDGRWMPPQHVLMTLVCRSGRVVPGRDEFFWLMAWRYSNHGSSAYDGDVYLATEHGWTGCIDERAGFSPALGRKPRHLSALAPEPPTAMTLVHRHP